jgi:hypothetical protein
MEQSFENLANNLLLKMKILERTLHHADRDPSKLLWAKCILQSIIEETEVDLCRAT